MVYLGKQSLEQGLLPVFTFEWAWGNFSDALSLYHDQFVRSFEYAGVATAIALVVSYPLAYWIAFRGGRWKNLFLLLVIAPFFVTYLIRTLAWETILADDGVVANTMRHLHLLGADGRLLATSFAVVAGITYNFLPFMVLPLYVSLEQIDGRLIEEAAMDLGANEWTTFQKVTLPLIMPGIMAAGLLAFALSVDDFVITYFNAGSTTTFPLFVWGAARVALPPQINVIGTAIFVVAVGGMLANIIFQNTRARRAGLAKE